LDQRIGSNPRPVFEQPAINFEPWRDMQGILNDAFTHDTLTHRAVTTHWKLLRENYEAWLQIAKLKPGEIIPVEKDKMLQFNETYLNPALRSYRPRLMHLLAPALAMIEERFAPFVSES
jgi:hypothetical protein